MTISKPGQSLDVALTDLTAAYVRYVTHHRSEVFDSRVELADEDQQWDFKVNMGTLSNQMVLKLRRYRLGLEHPGDLVEKIENGDLKQAAVRMLLPAFLIDPSNAETVVVLDRDTINGAAKDEIAASMDKIAEYVVNEVRAHKLMFAVDADAPDVKQVFVQLFDEFVTKVKSGAGAFDFTPDPAPQMPGNVHQLRQKPKGPAGSGS